MRKVSLILCASLICFQVHSQILQIYHSTYRQYMKNKMMKADFLVPGFGVDTAYINKKVSRVKREFFHVKHNKKSNSIYIYSSDKLLSQSFYSYKGGLRTKDSYEFNDNKLLIRSWQFYNGGKEIYLTEFKYNDSGKIIFAQKINYNTQKPITRMVYQYENNRLLSFMLYEGKNIKKNKYTYLCKNTIANNVLQAVDYYNSENKLIKHIDYRCENKDLKPVTKTSKNNCRSRRVLGKGITEIVDIVIGQNEIRKTISVIDSNTKTTKSTLYGGQFGDKLLMTSQFVKLQDSTSYESATYNKKGKMIYKNGYSTNRKSEYTRYYFYYNNGKIVDGTKTIVVKNSNGLSQKDLTFSAKKDKLIYQTNYEYWFRQ